jgi:Saxitoxin biosynthesis operon protein SxtJ
MHMNRPFDLKPTDRMLRQFSVLWIVAFLIVAARLVTHNHEQIAAVLAVVTLTIGLIGIFSPGRMKPLFLALVVLTYPIGWVVSHVILALMFYGLFTPIGLFFRLRGRDVLRLRPERHSPTYWQNKPSAKDKSQYLRQF